MWFKNLALFRLTEAFALTPDELQEKLEQMAFRPCGSHEEFAFGWTSPMGKSSEQLVHSANGFLMLCGKKEERVLPASVVNEMLQNKIVELEEQQGRKLSKKERTALKDELIFELLPRAFTFSTKTYAYIDPVGSWLIVDSASTKKAEDLLSSLRKCLGSLPAVPLNTVNKPINVMTDWLYNPIDVPDDIYIEEECELKAHEDDGGIVRCKHQDLRTSEVENHLDAGKQVTKLAVNWADKLSFVLDENLAVKRLKFLDLIQDQVADIEVNSEAEAFDADFSIMSLELANFLPRLVAVFGGVHEAT